MSVPYMPFFVGDYMADTGHLDATESGAYLHLIFHYWRTGGIPPDDELRRRITKMTHKQWSKSKGTVLAFFSQDGKHNRVDDELSKVAEKRSHLRDNALKSHEVRRANAVATQLPGSCIARASSEPEPEPKKIIDAGASIADAAASAARLQSEEDRKRVAEKRQTVLRSLGDRWNTFAGELRLPQIEEIKTGSPRERAALARVRDGCDFDRVFAKIRSSPFLRGEKGSTPASFDWITNPTNYQKIIEGNYDEVRQAQRR